MTGRVALLPDLGCGLAAALLYLRFDPQRYPVAMPSTG
jgi:hypothetical protein